MRKRGRILWAVMILIFICISCGKQAVWNEERTEQDKQGVSANENVENITVSVGNTHEKQKETEYMNCIVQIQTDNQRGSGILWKKEEAFWVFVTAAHVVEGLEQAEVYFVLEDKICPVQVYCVEGLDLAFLQARKETLTEDILNGYVECVAEQTEVKSDEVVTAIGYNASAEKMVQDGTVWESWIYVEDFDNYMLLCECEAQPGMSGGGVFTQNRELAGIVCGQDKEGMLAVLPVGVIVGEYDLFINY